VLSWPEPTSASHRRRSRLAIESRVSFLCSRHFPWGASFGLRPRRGDRPDVVVPLETLAVAAPQRRVTVLSSPRTVDPAAPTRALLTSAVDGQSGGSVRLLFPCGWACSCWSPAAVSFAPPSLISSSLRRVTSYLRRLPRPGGCVAVSCFWVADHHGGSQAAGWLQQGVLERSSQPELS